VDWDRLFLEALKRSRSEFDEKPDWRAALALYDRLAPAEQAELDRAVVAMIDEDYKNPHASADSSPWEEVLAPLPAGMTPDDLLCIEAAVMVAAERGIGEALFAFNRLMRAPRWHALYPRLEWLSVHGLEAQRKLAATRAGRYLGAMLGLAAGDALGATLEFMPREEVRRRYPEGHREMTGGGPFGWKPGEWTDDTAMALAVARGIAEAPEDPVPAVGRHFMAWYESSPPDVGNTCRTALEAFRREGSWEQAAAEVVRLLGDRAAGNGALMRTLPTPLAYGRETRQAVAIARMTHPHPDSDACVAAYHRMVEAALAGAEKEAVVAAGLEEAAHLAERFARAGSLSEAQVRASGYVVDSLEAALWAFLQTDSLEECIVTAVGLGDDADTVGAIAGGLAGAYYGMGALPRKWTATLRGRDQLEEAAARLFQVAHG
jgi:ADP-ribosyl-[dinitrogen reductase] hydrolase